MFRALTANLVAHERIETTDAKAKELRRVAERLITRARRLGPIAYTPHAELSPADRQRRQAAQQRVGRFLRRFAVVQMGEDERKIDLIEKVFVDLAQRYRERQGGYTRIVKLGRRRGDNAPMSLIELVDSEVSAAKARPKVEEPKAEEPKAEEAKADEAKAEKPKAEKPKAEEAKPAKAEEAKAEEAKAEEATAEEATAEKPKAKKKTTAKAKPAEEATAEKPKAKKKTTAKAKPAEEATEKPKRATKAKTAKAKAAKADEAKAEKPKAKKKTAKKSAKDE
jgi:large subunit ribosomal protein L17